MVATIALARGNASHVHSSTPRLASAALVDFVRLDVEANRTNPRAELDDQRESDIAQPDYGDDRRVARRSYPFRHRPPKLLCGVSCAALGQGDKGCASNDLAPSRICGAGFPNRIGARI